MNFSKPQLNIAVRAVYQAGDYILRQLDRSDMLKVEQKEARDYASAVDHKAEDIIISELLRSYPNHAILAEESGELGGDGGRDNCRWIIDPLDGTTNFLHGLPFFSVSIAMESNGRLELGVVYDPVRDELFTAGRGEGAFMNERRIRVSSTKELNRTLIGTGFPFRRSHNLDKYMASFKPVCTAVSGIRRCGSAALDLSYVACGRLDGFWEYGLRPWDIAAGLLLVKEAGGMSSNPEGENDDYELMQHGNVLSANRHIHPQLLALVTATDSAGSTGDDQQEA